MTNGPLNEIDLTKINEGLAALEAASAQIKQAESAGLDMTSQKQQYKEQRDKLLKMKQAYFPNR